MEYAEILKEINEGVRRTIQYALSSLNIQYPCLDAPICTYETLSQAIGGIQIILDKCIALLETLEVKTDE